MRPRILLVCLVLACSAVMGACFAVPSGGQSINEIQGKIDATRGKIGRKKGTEHVLSSDIARWTRRIDGLQVRISSLSRREVALQADLDRKRAELAVVQERLRAERARLARLRARLIVGRRTLARRLRELYTADQPDIVTVVLNSNGFADLLERGEFLKRISDNDREIVMVVRNAKRDATASAARLDVLQKRKQAVAAAILSRTEEVRQVRVSLVGTRSGYQRTRAGKQRALSSVREERQNLEGKLTVLQSTQRRIQARLARVAAQSGGGGKLVAGPVRGGSGGLIWPVNGPITSPFCESRAWESCHPGIDIGVPSGTPIRAAAAGTVALIQGTGSSGGYGNFTCIQHTGSMSTCYAHQSSIGVSSGQHVSQGQVIGQSGCTGRCFGPHLHFEVRINGAVTNPMNYL